MIQVLVIGGRGYVGRRVIAALGAEPGVEATVASRRPGAGEVRLDLDDPATFPALAGFHAVVDCADTLASDPAAALGWCLERGGPLFIETTAATARVEALLSEHRGQPPAGGHLPPPAGTAILGVGLFPGLSNLLAAEAAAALGGPCRRLEVGVRVSPLSGAGRGVRRLMVHEVAARTYRFAGGRRRDEPEVGPRVQFPFPGRRRPAWLVGLPEAAMLHASTGVPDTATYLAPAPAPMGWLLAAGGHTVFSPGPLRPAVLRLVAAGLAVVRGAVLRGKATAVELVARAEGEDGERRTRALAVDDGMLAAACATAAAVRLAVESGGGGGGGGSGLVLPDEIFRLGPTLERMRPSARALGLRLATPDAGG